MSTIERATKHLRDRGLIWPVDSDIPQVVADFRDAEVERYRAALKELVDASQSVVRKQWFHINGTAEERSHPSNYVADAVEKLGEALARANALLNDGQDND